MFNIPGRPGQTCEGPTRRELMRIGSLGLAGLHLPGFFLSQQSAKAANLAIAGAASLPIIPGFVLTTASFDPAAPGWLGTRIFKATSRPRAR